VSELSIDLSWNRKEEELSPGKFSSEHQVTYNEQYKVIADTAPDWGGSANNTNPEQALAASVNSYIDHAVAHLGKNSKKQMVVNRIDLNPVVSFDSGFEVSDEELAKMHDRAHRYCFIANTLDSEVEVNINI